MHFNSYIANVILRECDDVFNAMALLQVQKMMQDVAQLQLYSLGDLHLYDTLPVFIFALWKTQQKHQQR